MERRHVGLCVGVASNLLWYGASITVLGAILPRAIQEFSWSYVDSGFVSIAAMGGLLVPHGAAVLVRLRQTSL